MLLSSATHILCYFFLARIFLNYLLRTVVESVIRCILLSFSLCCDVELFIRILTMALGSFCERDREREKLRKKEIEREKSACVVSTLLK